MSELCVASESYSGLSVSSTVVAIKDQIYCNLNGEAVILDLSNGIYYGLDEIGARIWGLLQEPKPVSEIIDALIEEYDVDREHCESDLLALLDDLASKGLLATGDENIS